MLQVRCVDILFCWYPQRAVDLRPHHRSVPRTKDQVQGYDAKMFELSKHYWWVHSLSMPNGAQSQSEDEIYLTMNNSAVCHPMQVILVPKDSLVHELSNDV